MIDLTGRSIGKYHLVEPLGKGGMATVYKAYDTQLERDVAIKLIRLDQFGSAVVENLRKRFEREAKTLAKLTHPNIVGIIDFGEFDGTPYLVMEYLPSGTLKEKMGSPVPFAEAVSILLPIANALAFAHQKEIIHRDVKPANILITASGEPMLTDFGIAKILDQEGGQTLTGTGVGIGTPEYMAPEQAIGKAVDGRADIYSLGIVFYELVTGSKPFSADTPMAVVFKHMTDPLPRPSSIVGNIPEEVEHVLIKALAKKPEDRYLIVR
jgi:serine/threonine protein kinase